MIKRTVGMAALVLACASATTMMPVSNAQAADASVKCDLVYNLSGWSLIYKRAEGTGTVTCNNGQSANVKISVVGGGLTAGKYRINNGKGEISNVHGIKEVFGDYAQAGAEAGVVKSSQAQVLTKGTVSLALAGTGEGVNLGISAGKFTISPR
jgi:aryl-alcohol dehydrogenase-like predicted oxidoreductase